MKNKIVSKRIVYLIITVLILILTIYRFKSDHIMYYFMIILSLAFIIRIVHIIFKILNPNWLLSTGRYDEAINQFSNIINKYEDKAKVKNAASFNIALCYSRMGNFEKSAEHLNEININIMDKYLQWNYFILKTVNVMLLGEDVNDVEPYLKRALNILEKEEFYPVEAYFHALKGNNDECLNYIHLYLDFIEGKKVMFSFVKSSAIVDKFVYSVQNNFFIGVCYLKMNNWVLAKQYLKIVCKCDYDNYFSRKSKELLEVIR